MEGRREGGRDRERERGKKRVREKKGESMCVHVHGRMTEL